jgi:hypothetical protein
MTQTFQVSCAQTVGRMNFAVRFGSPVVIHLCNPSVAEAVFGLSSDPPET